MTALAAVQRGATSVSVSAEVKLKLEEPVEVARAAIDLKTDFRQRHPTERLERHTRREGVVPATLLWWGTRRLSLLAGGVGSGPDEP